MVSSTLTSPTVSPVLVGGVNAAAIAVPIVVVVVIAVVVGVVLLISTKMVSECVYMQYSITNHLP